MKKTNLNTDNLSIAELFEIKGGAAVASNCPSLACKSSACSSNGCVSSACETLACNTKACNNTACKTGADTSIEVILNPITIGTVQTTQILQR